MIYEAWRITYQSSEAAARAAYNTVEKLHAENAALNAEIEILRARVQELGEMARENRSKKVIELEGRIAELEASESRTITQRDHCEEVIDRMADAVLGKDRHEWTSNYDYMDAAQEVEGRIAELEEQMAAIGAGGVAPLRKRAEVAPQACIALKPLGNYSTNSAVTAEMARMLRDHFPAPAHPAEGVPAQTTRDAVIQHLTNAGVLEHDGCGIFIASGDASELIDACMALSTHAHHEKGAAAQAVASWQR